MATWNSGFEPSVITDQIEKTKSFSDNGRVSFSGVTHTGHVSVLTSILRLDSEIPESESQRIINSACFAAAKDGKVTPDRLRKHAEELEREYLRVPKNRFRLVTSISANFSSNPITIRSENSEICFGRKPNRATEKNRLKLIEDAKKSIYGELPSSYSPVFALVSARNPAEAATRALNQIDLFRAIWNLWKNRSQSIRISFGKLNPVNSLILGPIHTLHTPSGELASDSWWYEPTYLGPISVWRENQRHLKMLGFTKNVRASLRKIPYRDSIESALVRYVRSLDSRSWNTSFLDLWSILEALTGTTIGDSHKVTVRRAAFLFKDSDYAVQVLNHLRSYRNTAVHGGKEGQNVEPIMYQVKSFVEALLEFHLARAGQFETLIDVAAFLDLPPGLAEIDRQLARLKAVRRYIAG